MRNRIASTILFLVTGLLVAAFFVTAPAGAADESVKLTTDLNGAEEVPGPGDPDGSGSAKLVLHPDSGRICYVLKDSGIADGTAAHLHRGAAGTAGPVVVPMSPPGRGASAGCVDADLALVAEIAGNPSGFYVNIHNAEFAAGALRGQLGD